MSNDTEYTLADEYMRLIEWGAHGQGEVFTRAWWNAQRVTVEMMPKDVLERSVGQLAQSMRMVTGETVEALRARIRNEAPPEEFAPDGADLLISENTFEELVDDWLDEAEDGEPAPCPQTDRQRRWFDAGVRHAMLRVINQLHAVVRPSR